MLLKNETTIIRVLKQKGNQSLIIDCIKRTMPQWVNSTSLLNFIECDESEFYQQTGAIHHGYDLNQINIKGYDNKQNFPNSIYN